MDKPISFRTYLEYEFQTTYTWTDDSSPEACDEYISEMSTTDLLYNMIDYCNSHEEADDAKEMEEFLIKLLDK